MSDKPVTKTEARKVIREIREQLSIALYAIDRNDEELFEGKLSNAVAWSAQLYTDIFDQYVGTGLRGVTE